MNWFKRLFIRNIRIRIQMDVASLTAFSFYGKSEFLININNAELLASDYDFKTTLAHELGHFMDTLVNDGLPQDVDLGYTLAVQNKVTTLPVLKWEASAWRNAKQMYPGLDTKTTKKAFSSYFKRFRRDNEGLVKPSGNRST